MECCNLQQTFFIVTLSCYLAAVAVLWHSALLKPFKLFTVFLHEFSHAIAVWLTCNRVTGIEVRVSAARRPLHTRHSRTRRARGAGKLQRGRSHPLGGAQRLVGASHRPAGRLPRLDGVGRPHHHGVHLADVGARGLARAACRACHLLLLRR